jgi:hypothetical protein
MKLPAPGTEAFYQLGPEARKLARWRHNSTPLKEKKEQSSRSLNSFIGEKA